MLSAQTTRLATAAAMFLLPPVEVKATRPNPFAVQRITAAAPIAVGDDQR
jgi:hypothetical protein